MEIALLLEESGDLGVAAADVVFKNNERWWEIPVDPADYLQLKSLRIDNDQQILIAFCKIKIGKPDHVDVNLSDRVLIFFNVLNISWATKPISINPIENNVTVKTTLPMCPIVRRTITIHLVRDIRVDKIQG